MSTFKGLNDRIELLKVLRFYLRYQNRLIDEGWLSASDFIEVIDDIIRRYAIILLSEE